MKNYKWMQRLWSALTASAVTAGLCLPFTFTAHAESRSYISDIRLAAGADAVDALEEEGYLVMLTGLNIGAGADTQVYLGYKINEGDPITNLVISPNVGAQFTDDSGIVYDCASEIDVDEGIGGSAGCIYYTKDRSLGAPIVGLDLLRKRESESDELLPITNDGAEIVRTPAGTPADLDAGNAAGMIYLAQIRDGIVRPFISEIGIVTDEDKWNAVYTACERGYNYFVDGDIDDSEDTYTILVYKRTANADDALTAIAAVDASTVQLLESSQIIDTPAAGAAAETTDTAETASAETTDTTSAETADTTTEEITEETTSDTTTDTANAETTGTTDTANTETTGTTTEKGPLTAAGLGISGCEYVRVSSKPVDCETPYYLYQTKDRNAGNPISMLYAEKLEEEQNYLFGTWAMNYFFVKGQTTAYSYNMGDSMYNTLMNDTTVYTKRPVQLLSGYSRSENAVQVTETTAPAETTGDTAEATGDITETTPETTAETTAETTEETSETTSETTTETAVETTTETEPAENEPAEPENNEPEADEPPAAQPAPLPAGLTLGDEVTETEPEATEPVTEATEPVTEAAEAVTEETSIEAQPDETAGAPAETFLANPNDTPSWINPAQQEEETAFIGIAVLTAKEGLPEFTKKVAGLREIELQAPFIERDERSDRTNKFPASVFGENGTPIVILGLAAIAAGVGIGIFIIRKPPKDEKKKR